jgi:succinylarginine dihydrolase
MKTIDIELTEKLRNLVGKHLISSTSTTVSTKDAINIYEIRSQLLSAKNGLVIRL